MTRSEASINNYRSQQCEMELRETDLQNLTFLSHFWSLNLVCFTRGSEGHLILCYWEEEEPFNCAIAKHLEAKAWFLCMSLC